MIPGRLTGPATHPPDIVAEPAGRDATTGIQWQRFTVQGVSVLVSGDGGKDWSSNLAYDICDPMLEQYFVVEHGPSSVRFRIDLDDAEVRFNSTPNAVVRTVADEIERSFSGVFAGDPRLNGTPQPTPIAVCDVPPEDIPAVQRGFDPTAMEEAGATPLADPSSTPVTMPSPIIGAD